MKAFFRTINEETIRGEPEPGMMPPVCECYEQCALRKISGDDDSGVWVCQFEICMFNQIIGADASQHQLSSGQHDVDSFHNRHSARTSASARSHEVMSRVEGAMNKGPEEFWNLLDSQMITPEETATRLLTAFLAVPNCQCGLQCKIIMCMATG